MASEPVYRFFGGPPGRTLVWLAFLSVVIGFILHEIGLDPMTLLRRLGQVFDNLIENIRYLGSDVIVSIGIYFVYGAIVVVPLWLISRVLSMGKR